MGKSTTSLIDSVRSTQPNNLLAIHETFVHKTIHRFHQGCTGHWEHRDIPGGPITEARETSPTLGGVFKLQHGELQKVNTPKVFSG